MSRLSSRLLLGGLCLASRFLPRGSQHAGQRILIAHHLLLGDTLMLAGLLAKLREQYPQAEIVMTCPKAILPLFAAAPYGVKALAYDPRDAQTLRALWQQRGFDLALLPADTRLSWLASALGARRIVGFAGDRPAYKNWPVHELRPWPTTPTALGDTFPSLVDGDEPQPYRREDWPLLKPQPFAGPQGEYAVLHLGASSRLKNWLPERWAALAQHLAAQGITPVWSAGAKEVDLVRAADPSGQYQSFAGQLDLLQLAHLVRGARILVCPDTGVAHLGRIVGTPTLTLFGPGSALLCGAGRFWQHSPYLSLAEPIDCRNQHTLFKREIVWVQRCGRPQGDWPAACPEARCMQALTLESVQAAVSGLLAHSSVPAAG